MAAALFNAYADPSKAQAVSAGTQPGPAVHPGVVTVMKQLDIDLSDAKPQKLTPELAEKASLLVTMVSICSAELQQLSQLQQVQSHAPLSGCLQPSGTLQGCGEACPYVPGLRRLDWPLPDPKGQSEEATKAIRDDIKQKVLQLIQDHGWGRS